MKAPPSDGVQSRCWRDAFSRRLSDGLIVASAVSLTVIGITVLGESVSAQAAVAIVLALYGLAVLSAAATAFFGRLAARSAKAPKADIDAKKSKAA